jgi:very-short-patch-repair endonuclease
VSWKIEFARDLRRKSTDAESLLWRHLCGRRLAGYKFRRQLPMGRYIVDFVCSEAKFLVEVDGGQHAENVADRERDEYFAEAGFEVLRIWNTEVFKNTAGVLERIHRSLQERLPSPATFARDLSPRSARER